MSSAINVARHLALCVAVAILLGGLDGQAQSSFGGVDPDPSDPGTGGRNMINGHIYLPNGQLLNRKAKVQLTSLRSGTLFTVSDDNGAFTFRRLSGGSYQLTIDAGKDYEIATETVDIIESGTRRRESTGQTISVQIYLRPRSVSTEKLGTVDATLVGIPQSAAELYKQALNLSHDGKNKEAIEKLKEALTIYPKFVSAYNELGVQYMRLGQLAEAAEALRAALRLSPYVFTPRLNYGIVLVKQKEFAAAEVELRRALERDDRSVPARLYLSRALIGLGKHADAEALLRQTLALGGPEANLAHRYLGALYIERGAKAQAIDELETYLRLEPQDKDANQIREIIRNLKTKN
jgi:tetratricopeptide (TPR) repeat protein